MEKKERVKALKGLFRGYVGEIHDKFEYNNKELFIIKFNKFFDKQTGQRKPGWTTVTKDEFEVTKQPVTYKEI